MQLAESNETVEQPENRVAVRRLRPALGLIAVALLAFAGVVLLQWKAGAFTAEFSGYPDEASHYLSGLLVRDYIAAGLPNPMPFAEKFYIRYPYIGIGHWPPLFYALEGCWMLLFSPARVSVMILMALITALIAVSTYKVIREDFGRLSAAAAAVLLVLLPLVQLYSAMVMLDTLLAVLSFWAVLYFARFLDTERWQDGAGFGILSAIAILTKGNAFDLALVPPLAVLLTRRFGLLKRAGFWIPAIIVLLVSVPVHVLTMHLMLPTFGATLGLKFTETAIRFYSMVLWKSVGPLILAFAAVGFFTRVIRPLENRAGSKWIAAAALLLCLAIFYCAVPAGTEARYVIAALPPLFMFFVAGADYIAHRIPIGSLQPGTRRNALVLATVAVFLATSFEVPKKISYGFRGAARDLVSRPDFETSLSMVSSNTNLGEGIFISEAAMAGRHNPAVMLRASKVLADNDWNDMYYHVRYATPEVLNSCLEKTRVQYLILDVSPARKRSYRHHEELMEIVDNPSSRWKLSGSFAGDDEKMAVRIYRSAEPGNGSAVGASPPEIFANTQIGIDRWPLVVNLNCEADSWNGQPVKP
jgi:hypothetical protein